MNRDTTSSSWPGKYERATREQEKKQQLGSSFFLLLLVLQLLLPLPCAVPDVTTACPVPGNRPLEN